MHANRRLGLVELVFLWIIPGFACTLRYILGKKEEYRR